MPYITIDNIRFHYRVSKRAPEYGTVAVCLHGSGACGVVWSYQMSRLSRHFKIIIPDLPGHGKSDGQPLESAEAYTQWLDHFREELKLTSFFLMGHSFGGAIAQEYTRLHPDKVQGVVLVGTGTSFKLSKRYRQLYEQELNPSADKVYSRLPNFSNLSESFKKGYEMLRKNSNDALHADLLAAARFNSSAWISSISVPALVIWGSEDIVTPRDLPEELGRRLPESEFRIIQGAGHVVMVDKRDEFNNIIVKFIKENST